jgi:hypothetical protein
VKVRLLRKRFYRKSGGARQIGRRCKDYCAGCIVCDSYRMLDEIGRFPRSFDEAHLFSELCMRQDEAAQ